MRSKSWHPRFLVRQNIRNKQRGIFINGFTQSSWAKWIKERINRKIYRSTLINEDLLDFYKAYREKFGNFLIADMIEETKQEQKQEIELPIDFI